jgi:hypothetical protein
METIIVLIIVVVVLGGLVFIAKHFLKPPKGPLPDCCKGGNRNIQV